MAHRLVDNKQDELVPTISFDYMFFGTEGGVAAHDLPVLVVKDRCSKATWSHLVPSKGIEHPWPEKVLKSDLNKTGYKRVVLKCDQEPATKALAMRVKET